MELFKLSDRLKTVADMIKRGNVVADIGTDHAYLPVYIVKNNITDRVIAMDVRKGPLNKALNNVQQYGVSKNIELRLSDGLKELKPSEADTVTICGMGGQLIQTILENGKDKITEKTQLIVSPQSEIRDFRKYLYDNSYYVEQEKMIDEDGQFYLIIECYKNNVESSVISDGDRTSSISEEVFFRYGRTLLEQKNQSLYKYLIKEKQTTESIYNKVSLIKEKDTAVERRLRQLEFDSQCIQYALDYYLD